MYAGFRRMRPARWIALMAGAALVAPHPIAATSATYAVGKGPQGVVSDGVNIWVANQTDNTVTKLLASTGATVGTYAVGLRPISFVFDGVNIWVTTSTFTNGGVNPTGGLTELLASTGVTVGVYTVGIRPGGIV